MRGVGNLVCLYQPTRGRSTRGGLRWGTEPATCAVRLGALHWLVPGVRGARPTAVVFGAKRDNRRRTAIEPRAARYPGVTPEEEFGRGDWIRTSDPLRPRQVRYQAALRPDRRGTSIIARFRPKGWQPNRRGGAPWRGNTDAISRGPSPPDKMRCAWRRFARHSRAVSPMVLPAPGASSEADSWIAGFCRRRAGLSPAAA